jgi:glutamate-1-semialdehyde 2,1-aminomutase
MDTHQGSLDSELKARAARVIPGGLWGHQRTAILPEGYPQYFARARGCHLWDVDGREYIDLMCTWGPIVLGHLDPDVEAAVRAQQAEGDCMNGPSARLVELAEAMVERIPHADWAMFSKNGSDATTSCVTIARAGTGRRKLLVARGAYHGSTPWFSPYPTGMTAEDRAHIIFYEYNDVASLTQAAAEAGDDLAAILVSAFRHDFKRDHELPTTAFATTARSLCDRAGAALIVDDVRAGFRLHRGGSWELVGVRPDLSAWSKAIANGYALSAVTGKDRFRDAAASIFVTGSFWCGAVSMAAALATLRKLDAVDGIAHMAAMGQRLRDGLQAQADARGIAIRQTGPVQLPILLFEGDEPEHPKGFAFCAEALKRGAYLHPTHTMFLSVAHTPADIDRVLEATDGAFEAVAARFGSQ